VELEDVFRAYQRAVFAYFLRVVGNRQDARNSRRRPSCGPAERAVRFRGDAKVSTWLFGIPRRVLLEAVRAGLFERPSEFNEQT
jgi:hypothetical protein